MSQTNYQALNNETFIKLIKGELIDDPAFHKYYDTSHTNLEKTIILDGVDLSSIYLEEDTDYPYSLHISNSRIGGISILKGKFESMSFQSIEVYSNAGLSIKGGVFKSLDIDGTVEGFSLINGGDFDSLSFANIEFKSSLSVNNGYFKSIRFSGIKTNGLFIGGGEYDLFQIQGGAKINDCIISELHFQGGKFETVQIYGLTNIDRSFITSGKFETLSILSEGLKEIKIDASLSYYSAFGVKKYYDALEIKNLSIGQLGRTHLWIKNIEFNTLIFENSYINKDSIIRINNAEADTLIFENIINYGQININDFTSRGTINFKNSDLGKTTFISSDIAESILTFQNSKISEVFLSGTKMPEHIEGNSENQRLGYGQIRRIYENRGDIVETTNFFSKEMNAYYNTLDWGRDFWEKLNVSLNFISTNHGLSWRRGLASAVLFSTIFYWLYCLLLGINLELPSEAANLNYFFHICSFFFDFINPVHKTDSISEGLGFESATPLARIIEGISRIFIAYFIYQFVQAFRRLGKK
jgi:hypothetical protein